LGLQTASDNIGKTVNRGFSTETFINAVKKLKEVGIDVVAHLMVGLPGESEKDIYDTVKIINACGCDGIKIHSTFVLENTKLATMVNDGRYIPITLEYYVDKVIKILSNLDKGIIVHRITGDPPKDKLLEPKWTLRKKVVINEINKQLNKLNVFQGDNKIKFIDN
jgi:radical SAM protein (TIGR01212 family)